MTKESTYLRRRAVAGKTLSTADDPRLDGIIFPSAQVKKGCERHPLFHESARVAEEAFPKGTEIAAITRPQLRRRMGS